MGFGIKTITGTINKIIPAAINPLNKNNIFSGPLGAVFPTQNPLVQQGAAAASIPYLFAPAAISAAALATSALRPSSPPRTMHSNTSFNFGPPSQGYGPQPSGGRMGDEDFWGGVTDDAFTGGEEISDEWGGGYDNPVIWDGGGPNLGSLAGLGGFGTMAGRGILGSALPAMGGAAMAAGGAIVGLGTKLARMFAGRGATFVINGVKGKVQDLWPLARKYGPQAVATALGVSAAELAQMLAQSPTGGRRRRRRGISAANISTARRVIKFNKQLSRQLGTNSSRGRSSYRPRGRHAHYFR